MKLVELLIIVLGGILLLVGLSLLMSLPVYWLWNGCLVGAVDGVHEVTWLQAWGISFLFGMLFKNSNTKSKKD
jgi:hypothetical protein